MAQYDLVFEGGGAKGSVFIGAMQEFEAQGHSARRFIGTSAGSITAVMMASGYSSEEMLQIAKERVDGEPRFLKFLQVPDAFKPEVVKDSLTYKLFSRMKVLKLLRFLRKSIDDALFRKLMKSRAYRALFSFVERGGLYAGDNFLAWVQEKLNAKHGGLGDGTLKNFHEVTGNDLSLVASDLTGKEMLVLNHRTAPDCPVAWAVRMSMSIPFCWQEVIWQSNWGLYLKADISEHVIVDGGVLSNFPIKYLTESTPEVIRVMGSTDPALVPNLGLLIDEELEVPNAGAAHAEERENKLLSALGEGLMDLKTLKRILRLLDTLTSANDLSAIRTYDKEICRLPAKGYGTLEFDMTDERLDALLAAGRTAMHTYLESRS